MAASAEEGDGVSANKGWESRGIKRRPQQLSITPRYLPDPRKITASVASKEIPTWWGVVADAGGLSRGHPRHIPTAARFWARHEELPHAYHSLPSSF